jgi:ElaB/YqjD/DUF883 family membrane-anchored ribosome-binding protein
MAAMNSPIGIDQPASDRLREQANAVTEDIQGMGAIAKEVAQEKLEELRENAAATYEQGRDKVREATHTLERFIEEQPLTSVLIAAGVGLFLGRFWMRP